MEEMEKEKRKKNLIMSGLVVHASDANVVKQEIKNFINEHQEIDVGIKAVTKLETRMCLLEVENKHELKNKSKLKGLKTEKVFINEDITKVKREKQKQVRLKAKAERESGKIVKIGHSKLVIDGKEWR